MSALQPATGAATAPAAPTAVIADDHGELAEMIADQLAADGWRAHAADSGTAAIAAIGELAPELVITDLRMPGADGFAVLDAAPQGTAVIVMTAFGDVPTAVEAMRRGAWQFVEKPVKMADLVRHARRALDRRRVPAACGPLVGDSPAMRELMLRIARVARAAAPVLIRGESGTGKELVARAIHGASARAAQPFVAVNCAAIPEPLVESELFGHARGAFTGAASPRAGLFAQADGGTLFLDEIGDMPLAVQAKLLRVLQEREVRAVGADAARAIDVRVVAATHQRLEDLVRAGAFRADLFYRLEVVPLEVPPLRERAGDVARLARHFLARARQRDPACGVEALGDDLVAALEAYAWPGNVRELEHVIERLAIFGARAEPSAEDLRRLAPELTRAVPFVVRREELVTLRELEAEYIAWVLERCEANKARAAAILGVDPSTLYRRARARPGGPRGGSA